MRNPIIEERFEVDDTYLKDSPTVRRKNHRVRGRNDANYSTAIFGERITVKQGKRGLRTETRHFCKIFEGETKRDADDAFAAFMDQPNVKIKGECHEKTA